MLLGRRILGDGRAALISLLALTIGGCGTQPSATAPALTVTVTAPIRIPSGQAHAVLQDGRLVGAGNQLEPYCEFEVRRVSGAVPQSIVGGEFRVARIRHSVLLDPTTRLPAFIFGASCTDPLYQESIWTFRSQAPSEALFLRCLAPYHHCAFGPPLTPGQVQQQVGRYLQIRSGEPFAHAR